MESNKIYFKEDTHQYFNRENGHEYTSVSHVLANFKHKFDSEKMAKFCAKKRGVSAEMILKEWEDNKNRACDKGTLFHAAMERFIKTKTIEEGYDKIIAEYTHIIQKQIPEYDRVLSEELLYNDEFEVAGTADLIFEHHDSSFTIGDFKTNRKFSFDDKFKKWMKYPVDHLPQCEYSTYALQLALYAYMYERLTGKKCRGLLLLWRDFETQTWTPIRCNYMRHEVEQILKCYRNQ